MKNRTRQSILLLVLAALFTLAGCAKKSTPPPPPPPPPPPQPTASLSANPDSIQAGQSTQLTWRTENATDVSIDGIGKVDPNGSKTVSPTESTTYRLIAKGAGGTQDATARVTVESAVAPVSETEEQMFTRQVQDVFFDYDSFSLRQQALLGNIPYYTTVSGARAAAEAIAALRSGSLEVAPLQSYFKGSF